MRVSEIDPEDRKAHGCSWRFGSKDERHGLVESLFNCFMEV